MTAADPKLLSVDVVEPCVVVMDSVVDKFDKLELEVDPSKRAAAEVETVDGVDDVGTVDTVV